MRMWLATKFIKFVLSFQAQQLMNQVNCHLHIHNPAWHKLWSLRSYCSSQNLQWFRFRLLQRLANFIKYNSQLQLAKTVAILLGNKPYLQLFMGNWASCIATQAQGMNKHIGLTAKQISFLKSNLLSFFWRSHLVFKNNAVLPVNVGRVINSM